MSSECYCTWFVYVSACLLRIILGFEATWRLMSESASLVLQVLEKDNGDFPETAVFQSYDVKHEQKANMLMEQ